MGGLWGYSRHPDILYILGVAEVTLDRWKLRPAMATSQFAVSGPRVKEFQINSLTPMTPEPEAESCPVREWLRSCELHGGSFIDPCGLGALMPEEETESPEEVRSQRRRSLPNVDE